MKNELIAVVQHKYAKLYPIEAFVTNINGSEVNISSSNDDIYINIASDESYIEVDKLFHDILSIMFLCFGSFPHIAPYRINGELRDITRLVSKYNSCNEYNNSSYGICSITPKVINEKVINTLRQRNLMPFYSFQYLFCDAYTNVLIPHKLTMLLHAIQGIVGNTAVQKAKKECKKYAEWNGKGSYLPCVYSVCKRFFEINNSKNCNILTLLNISEYDFLRTLTDTRDWYSHFNYDISDKKVLDDGDWMAVYFTILGYMLRIKLLAQLNITITDDVVVKFLYIVHDWIVKEILKDTSIPYKSPLYKLCCMDINQK